MLAAAFDTTTPNTPPTHHLRHHNIYRHIHESVETIKNFHLNTRAFQISKFNDPIYGYTSLNATFDRDEVPLALGDSNENTLDDTGLSEILDTTGGEKDCYRSASLCITAPRKIDGDGSNFPKWMVIFRGSFCDGDTYVY